MNIQQCKICGDTVNGYTSIMNFTFTNDTMEKISESVRLTCGCVMDFITFNIDFTSGIIDVVSELTGETLISYYDAEVQDCEEEDD